MNEKVNSIKDYIDCIEQIRKKSRLNYSMVFRGQGDSSWEICSTLERVGIPEISMKEYYEAVDYLKPEINSLGRHFERKWAGNGYDFDFTKWEDISFNRFPDIGYLSYLRHHGFPTPLIDVTQSEYIALFFACEDMNEERDAKVFVIRDDWGSSWVSGRPELHKIGHYLESDRRHIAQQSEYLLTARFTNHGKESEWDFVSFSSFVDAYSYLSVDFNADSKAMFEIEIVGMAKKSIMTELAKMNINHYTLYLDEDSLVKKLKYDFLRDQKVL